MEKYIATQVPT